METRSCKTPLPAPPISLEYTVTGNLAARMDLPCSYDWGPFTVDLCGKLDNWDLCIMTEKDESVYARIADPLQKWVLSFKQCDQKKDANIKISIDVTIKKISYKTLQFITTGEVLICHFSLPSPKTSPSNNEASYFLKLPKLENSATVSPGNFKCPYCAINFTKANTLYAHINQYCKQRPAKPIGENLNDNSNSLKRTSSLLNNGVPEPEIKRRPNLLKVAATIKQLSPSSLPYSSITLSPSSLLHNSIINHTNLQQHAQSVCQQPSSGTTGIITRAVEPLKFCAQCKLFFNSEELYAIHLQLGAEINDYTLSHALLTRNSLVQSAPVMTSNGLQYVPVHGFVNTLIPAVKQNGIVDACNNIDEITTPLDLRKVVQTQNTLSLAAAISAVQSPISPTETIIPVSLNSNNATYPRATNNSVTVNHNNNNNNNNLPFKNLRKMSAIEIANIPRPHLCTFCNTRFQSITTLMAHQKSYCQKIKICSSINGVGNSEVARHATNVVINRTEETVNNDVMSSDVKKQIELEQALQVTGSAARIMMNTKSGNTALSLSSSLTTSQSNVVSSSNCWHIMKHGYRCAMCGYLGQTLRGMKMHNKVHENEGSNSSHLLRSEQHENSSNSSENDIDKMIHNCTMVTMDSLDSFYHSDNATYNTANENDDDADGVIFKKSITDNSDNADNIDDDDPDVCVGEEHELVSGNSCNTYNSDNTLLCSDGATLVTKLDIKCETEEFS